MIGTCYNEGGSDLLRITLEEEAYKSKIPIRGTFELTPRCNFSCNMCYIHREGVEDKEISKEEWVRIAKEAKEEGLLFLTLTGGEVFHRKDFKDLYAELHKLGFIIQIFTNGYLIDEEVIKWLSEIPPMAIRITLYGASNDTYEKVCGIKDGFSRVRGTILLLKKNSIPVYLVGTISNDNYCDLERMVDFAKEVDIPFSYSTSLVNTVRGAKRNINKKRVSLSEVSSGFSKVDRLYPEQENILSNCGSYRKGFWVTWDGNLQLCSLLSNPSVSIKKKDFKNAWEYLNNRLSDLVMPESCSDCDSSGFCSRCPGLIENLGLDYICSKSRELKSLLYKEV